MVDNYDTQKADLTITYFSIAAFYLPIMIISLQPRKSRVFPTGMCFLSTTPIIIMPPLEKDGDDGSFSMSDA